MTRKSTMSVVLCSLEKQKKIINQSRTSSALFSSIVWLTKEILVNMSKINIFIIILLILNYEISGKHLYLSCIENDPFKSDIIYQRLQMDVAEQKRVKSQIVVPNRNPMQWNSIMHSKVIAFMSLRPNLIHSHNTSLTSDPFP